PRGSSVLAAAAGRSPAATSRREGAGAGGAGAGPPAAATAAAPAPWPGRPGTARSGGRKTRPPGRPSRSHGTARRWSASARTTGRRDGPPTAPGAWRPPAPGATGPPHRSPGRWGSGAGTARRTRRWPARRRRRPGASDPALRSGDAGAGQRRPPRGEAVRRVEERLGPLVQAHDRRVDRAGWRGHRGVDDPDAHLGDEGADVAV